MLTALGEDIIDPFKISSLFYFIFTQTLSKVWIKEMHLYIHSSKLDTIETVPVLTIDITLLVRNCNILSVVSL